MNKDGTLNVRHRHVPFLDRFNLYNRIIEWSEIRFGLMVVAAYICLNAFFATIYWLIGLEGINNSDGSVNWWDAFFFSSHTLTTLGYGHISPDSFWINIVASIEALVGFLSLSVATSLLYGRFTSSKAKLVFSENLLISPYNKSEHSIAIRVGNLTISSLSNMKAKIVMSWVEENEHGAHYRRYEQLPLVIDEINMFTTSWVILHHVNKSSPLKMLGINELVGLEFIIHVHAFDEVYNKHVHKKTSYCKDDIVKNAIFVSMTEYLPDHTIVDNAKINEYRKLSDVNESKETGFFL